MHRSNREKGSRRSTSTGYGKRNDNLYPTQNHKSINNKARFGTHNEGTQFGSLHGLRNKVDVRTEMKEENNVVHGMTSGFLMIRSFFLLSEASVSKIKTLEHNQYKQSGSFNARNSKIYINSGTKDIAEDTTVNGKELKLTH